MAKITARMKKNKEHNGIEIYFSSKPEETIRDRLKEKGFKWHYKKQCWFAVETSERLSLAKEICGTKDKKKQKKTATSMTSAYSYSRQLISPIASQRSSTRKWEEDKDYAKRKHAEAQNEPLGQFKYISPKDTRYSRKRSFFS